MKYFITLILIYCFYIITAQEHDAHWITGYGQNSGNPDFGISILRFNPFGKLDTTRISSAFDMDFLNVSFSDFDGDLLYYTNGVGVNNYLHELMDNGDGMNGFPGDTGEEWGYALRQGGVAVVWPDSPSQCFFLLEKSEHFPMHEDHLFKTTALLYNHIDMSANNGEGQLSQFLLPRAQLLPTR